MVNFRASLFFFLLLTSVNLLASQDDSNTLQLIKYIEDVSTLKYKGEELPEIRSVSPGMIMIYHYGEARVAKADYNGERLMPITGAYDHERNIIYISNQYDLNSESSLPTKIHELVHFMQNINGITKQFNSYKDCLEGEAYDIQYTWQHEFKILIETAPSYQLIIYNYMKCGQQFGQ